MITNDYARTMARYNRWQNRELYRVAGGLSDEQRLEGCDAFWGSIHGTLSHLCWADTIWLSRFDRVAPPGVAIRHSASYVTTWPELVERRTDLDAILIAWADDFAAGPVTGALRWFSGALGRDTEAPLAVVVTHIFNHQTHHHGQANALVAAAGGVNADTDLFIMPRDEWPG